MPKAEDVIEVMNPNYFCFAWEGTGKVIGAGLPDGGLPGMLAWPYPLICPGPQPNCYSLAYFDPMKAGDDIGQHKVSITLLIAPFSLLTCRLCIDGRIRWQIS